MKAVEEMVAKHEKELAAKAGRRAARSSATTCAGADTA